ncbi:MAG: UDP-N-acetylmuramoyl-L-alanine--D-glutamate ligase, partial [Patescibacteria group bacterium]
YNLSKQEADFWNIVYKKGLGEFFYRNNLDPKISPLFPYKKSDAFRVIPRRFPRNSVTPTNILVGVGGGKDSIVSAELLKEHGINFNSFSVETNNSSHLIGNIAKTIGKKHLKIRRFLDPQVFQNHNYNGHVPISAIYAFLGIFACSLYKYSGFIVSNEYSSNFGNIKYKGLDIHPVKSAKGGVLPKAKQFDWVNHQWSKSFEFEKLFQDYLKNFISPDLKYFSLLRPFYEIRIAKMFSGNNPSTPLRTRKYFPLFSSCNSNFKIAETRGNLRGITRKLWCNKCPKCVFTFTILSAFLTKKELLDIFGENLYEREELLPLFRDILGLGAMKPFDCVGTFEEAQAAFCLADKDLFANSKNQKESKKSGIVSLRSLCRKRDILRHKQSHKQLKVFRVNKESNIPEQFKFLGMENALILGYGKEGKATKKYLKKYYPKLKIGIGDEGQDKNYLKKQANFDIAIKTPGIKKELVKIPYTTATNMFFSKIKGKNIIIGVTGSKGKSTTASLIYEILKTAGKKTEFLGNIGKPMLERLLKPISKDTIFVLELSSYQLDDIKFSPDIAIVTSLFPEHLDYHVNLKNYYNAKKNIINFQGKENYFIYNSQNKETKNWIKYYRGNKINITTYKLDGRQFYKYGKLIGKHNENNIKSAIAVAKILKIKNKAIKKAIESFKSLPHRLEFIGEFKGIKFYNDAISTAPQSTIEAIKALKNACAEPGRCIDTIFLGGQDRGYDFSQLEKIIRRYKINNIALFPNSGKKIMKNHKGFNVLYAKRMEEAVKFAYEHTKKGKICLLSCASPSYSLWKNFEEKGQEFQKYVKQLGKNKRH